METSKAVVIKKFGGYDVISVEQFNLPPLEGHIEISVDYGGVNFADIYTRQGLMPHKVPFVLGMEVTGTITAIGAKDTNLQVGQRVICYDYKCGMFRDLIRVTPDKCYPLPDHIDTKEGAAIFVNYLTAYFATIELGHLKENEAVLILSCAGGVGTAATQFAKNISGVTVVGTCSPEKSEKAKEIGVDLTLAFDDDFKKNIIKECPKGFDLIVSNYSGSMFGFLESLLKPLGRIVTIGANNMIQNEKKLSPLTLLKAWWNTKNIALFDLVVNNRITAGLHLGTLIDKNPEKVKETLEKIFDMFKDKKVKVKIDSVFPFEQTVEATKMLGERKNVGKVLISMK